MLNLRESYFGAFLQVIIRSLLVIIPAIWVLFNYPMLIISGVVLFWQMPWLGFFAVIIAVVICWPLVSKLSPALRFYGYQKLFALVLSYAVMLGGYTALSSVIGLFQTSKGRIAQLDRIVISFSVPLLIAGAIYFTPDVIDRVANLPVVGRVFKIGGPKEIWAGAFHIKRYSETWSSKRTADGNILSASQYVGTSFFEHTFRLRDVFQAGPQHNVVYATTGGAKWVGDIASAGICHSGSCFLVSEKPEIANALAGRRQDPRWFDYPTYRNVISPGMDLRGITKVTQHIPWGRAFSLDPDNQGVHPTCHHPLLSDIPLDHPKARSFLFAIATGLLPPNENLSEPFFNRAACGAGAAVMGFVRTDPEFEGRRTLPTVVDIVNGLDFENDRCDPRKLASLLIRMTQNRSLGGFIANEASTLLNSSDKQRGAVFAELNNATRWITDPTMRHYLDQPADFSYFEMGDDAAPLSVFLTSPSVDDDARIAFNRMHTELCLAILKSKPDDELPTVPTWVCLDEYAQYGKALKQANKGALILRSKMVRLSFYLQSYPSLLAVLGEHEAAELLGCAAEHFFGLDCEITAKRVSDALGWTSINDEQQQLATVQDVLRLLRINSNIRFYKSAYAPIMRLERKAFKPIHAAYNGLKLRGIPELTGLYDEDLPRRTV